MAERSGLSNQNNHRLQTRMISSMDRVFPDMELKAAVLSHGQVFRGERFNFQMAYRLEDGPARGKLEIESPLSGITLRSVELEPGEYIWPTATGDPGCRTTPGLFPDILLPLEETWKIVPHQWRSLWVSIDIKEQEPGTYPIVLRMRINDALEAEETFYLDVLPPVLPKQKLKYTQWFHTDCIAQQYHVDVFSESWWELVEKYLLFAVEHGINMILTPLFTPPLDTLPGKERLTVQLVDITVKGQNYEFDFARLDRWIEMCERCGIEYLEGSHLFTQWGAAHAPKIIASVEGKQKRIFGWDTDAEGETYTSFLKQFLPALTEYLCQKGYADRFFFHISDEPSADQVDRYGRLSGLVHGLINGFPVMDALSDYAFYEKGFVDVPVCATEHIASYLEHQTEHLWAYYCGCHVHGVSNRLFAMPGARNRCIGLQMYESGIEGFLHWGYNFWLTQYATEVIDPYRVSDAGRSFLSGDSFSVYPGSDGPVAAVSLELFAEALQDLRALQLAEQVCGKETVKNWTKNISYREFFYCPVKSGEVLQVRELINREIMRCFQ